MLIPTAPVVSTFHSQWVRYLEACFGLDCFGPGSARVPRAALGGSPRADRMARAGRPSRHARRMCSTDHGLRFLQCLGACPEDLYFSGQYSRALAGALLRHTKLCPHLRGHKECSILTDGKIEEERSRGFERKSPRRAERRRSGVHC